MLEHAIVKAILSVRLFVRLSIRHVTLKVMPKRFKISNVLHSVRYSDVSNS